MEDAAHYGRVDYWTIPADGMADCEDCALAKRKALIALGLPHRALRIAIGRLPSGEAHAVLSVSTDRATMCSIIRAPRSCLGRNPTSHGSLVKYRGRQRGPKSAWRR